MAIYPVILSGGSGTRLWPLSRAALPKQLLALVSNLTLLQETALRTKDWPDVEAPVVVCNDEHRFLVAEQLRAIDVKPQTIFLEPAGRNTAPAIALVALALFAKDPEAILLVLPSDHIVRDPASMREAAATAISAARTGRLVAFGIEPTAPVTGYGYIERGNALPETEGCFRISRFIEKPAADLAEQLIASPQYSWNSGMFVLSGAAYLQELTRLQPKIIAACKKALGLARHDLEFTRLDEDAFATSPSISIDYAVMEHTELGAVVPVNLKWSDVGSWNALWEIGDKDDDCNVITGDVIAQNVSGSLVHSQSRMVALLGVEDLVVVETADAVLVTRRDQSQNVKTIVDKLNAAKRSEQVNHRRVYRPWGYYESMDAGERFQVKRLVVNPGGRLSLQMHHHRAEHWVVVSGTAKVTRGSEVMLLSENQSTYIPLGISHRLENPGKIPLHLVEVQSGGYLGEDDIVRTEDVYNRAVAH